MQKNFDLTPFNTLQLASVASFGGLINSVDQLSAAKVLAEEQGLPLIPIGEGSNLVLPAKLNAVVVVNRILNREVVFENDTTVHLRLGGGENWHDIVEYCLGENWYGLENLALIPGCVGAAPVQNIGAYGVELKDVFESLTVFDLHGGNELTLNLDECQFGYRDSLFKNEWMSRGVITSVTLRLLKKFTPHIDYPALQHVFHKQRKALESVNGQDVFDTVCAIRRSKLPDPIELPNAGSFFKNPVVSQAHYCELKEKYSDLVAYPVGQNYKLAAGWLIEKSGWKGRKLGSVGMHKDQALVLVNYESAEQADVLALAQAVTQEVKNLFQVTLEIEPRVYTEQPSI